MKTPILFTTVALLLAGPALADDGRGKASLEPSAPVAIRDALAAGGGTIAGTVVETGPRGFTVADAAGQRVRVQARDDTCVRSGEPVTVTGRADDGRIEARQIVRGDGTPVQRQRHRHGRDDG